MVKRVTMMEIAAMVGVSQATVSLVLTNAPKARVAEATRARVMAAARQLGYEFAPRLGVQRTRVVGLIVSGIDSTSAVAPFLAGATDRALQDGVMVGCFAATGDARLEHETVRLLGAAGALGAIYVTLTPQIVDPPAFYDELPLVLVNCSDRHGLRPSVLAGNVDAGFTATKALLAAGHRRIGHLTGDRSQLEAEERERGFRSALASENVPVDETLIVAGTGNARDAARGLLARPDRPTALFCFDDLMALACYEAAAELGLNVPADLSVIGCGDGEAARQARPPLSSMSVPYAEMASAAVEMLLKMTAAQSRSANTVTVHSRLVGRGSVQRIG